MSTANDVTRHANNAGVPTISTPNVLLDKLIMDEIDIIEGAHTTIDPSLSSTPRKEYFGSGRFAPPRSLLSNPSNIIPYQIHTKD